MNPASRPPPPGAVAIVEDDPAIADSLRMVLEWHGWSVQVYDRGEAFVSAIRDGAAPDCVVLDLVLPGIDGVRMLESLAESELRVVVLSAYPNRLSTGRAHELGVQAMLTKPVSPDALVTAIEKAAANT